MSGATDLQLFEQLVSTANELFLSDDDYVVINGVTKPTLKKIYSDFLDSKGVYPTVSDGLAATNGSGTQNRFFTVPGTSDSYESRYRNDAGTAVLVGSVLSSTYVNSLLAVFEARTKNLLGRKIPGTGFLVIDSKSGKCLWTDDQGKTHSISHDTFQQFIKGVEQIPQVKTRRKGVTYTYEGANGLALVVIRDDGLIELPKLNVADLRIGGKSVSAGAGINLNDTYMRDGQLLKYHANPLSVSGWGSSSMERMASQFASMIAGFDPDASYYNGGKGGERSTHIAGRLGSIPFKLTVAGASIPASGGVTVTGSNVLPSTSMKPFAGWLNGVYGTVSSTSSVMTFTRAVAGAATPSVGEFPFIPEIGPQHRGDVVFLWMGKNDVDAYTAQEIIGRTDVSFDWLSPFIKRCLVLGHFHNSDWAPDSSQSQKMDAVNAAHKLRYGSLFVDVQAYLMSSQVWVDTGINPTSGDLAQQALGQKPDSLSVDADHLNDAAYLAINEHVLQPLIRQLGWY
jgi:hypothetical protein